MWPLFAKMAPPLCGFFSNIICISWEAKPCFCPLDLSKFTNNSRWWWGVMEIIPAMVLQSHSRASDRPPDIISDQIVDSNSFKRDNLNFMESLPSTSSSQLGSDKNKLIILWRGEDSSPAWNHVHNYQNKLNK